MRLKDFRVQMYRCVIDSGWVDADSLTVLVGKNEVGKTSLLKALHKLNPYRAEPYVMDSEWPRGRRAERNNAQDVCTARFELSDADIKEIASLTATPLANKVVEVSRDYGGQLKVNCSVGPSLDSKDIEAISASLPVLQEPVTDPFKGTAEACLSEIRGVLPQGSVEDLTQVMSRNLSTLQKSVSPGNQQPQAQNEQRFIAGVNEVLKKVQSTRPVNERVALWVKEHLPTFIYMSDYRAFAGSAQLDQVKQRKDRNQLTEEDRTLLMIMQLSGLDLDKEVVKGGQADREQRQYDLNDASATLTRTISDRWRQRKYEVEFRADGQLFYTFVKDSHDPALIKLEERSQGFQWFFSFDMMFMFESRGTFKGCVILLDEPGLHLHPEAQRDLLKRLEEYAKDNTLLYTTHLPFLIDLQRPERIRVLNETDHGTIVTSDLNQSQPEAKFVLQAALGMSGSTSYLVAKRNLVVEGVDDYWILTELSNLLKRSGKPGLPEDMLITPAGGASEAAYIATFMIGQNLDVVVLLDSDAAGESARKNLVNKWLTRYKSSTASIISLGEAVGVSDGPFSIEDLFTHDFYLERVKRVYARELAAASKGDLKLVGVGSTVPGVERTLTESGIKFNKGSVAKIIRKDLSAMMSIADLPDETQKRGTNLINSLRSALPGAPE
jgi:predicted ATP-dependent endonuclease of OLD family